MIKVNVADISVAFMYIVSQIQIDSLVGTLELSQVNISSDSKVLWMLP